MYRLSVSKKGANYRLVVDEEDAIENLPFPKVISRLTEFSKQDYLEGFELNIDRDSVPRVEADALKSVFVTLQERAITIGDLEKELARIKHDFSE